MKVRQLVEEAEHILHEAGVPDALWDAKLLFFETFQKDAGWLLAHGDDEIEASNQEKDELTCGLKCGLYRERIAERAKRIPLQHILGHTGFMGLDFKVNEHVLIPRPDTEILVEETLKYVHDGMKILDMCTGSGCILISLLEYTNDCIGVGVDISESALEVASDNAYTILKNRPEKEFVEYSFIKSDMFSEIPKDVKFDIIVSNPPYIKHDVIDTLEAEVKDHDPMNALDGGADGLDFYRIIAEDAYDYLNPGGYLLMEIGYDQAEDVVKLLKAYKDVEVIKDFAGLDRVVKAYRPVVV